MSASTNASTTKEIIYPEIPSADAQLTPTSPKQSKPQQPVLTGDLKSYCWRITASYLWVKLILGIFGWGGLAEFESLLAQVFFHLLYALKIDFSPLTSISFSSVFKFGWLLIITGVRPLQLIGFLFYVIFFPFGVVIYVLARLLVWEGTPSEDPGIAREVGRAKSERQKIAISAVLLFAWLLLYGGSNTLRQIIPGAVFSASLFLFLVVRLFQRASPVTDKRYFRPLLSINDSLASITKSQLETLLSKYKAGTLTRSELTIPRFIFGTLRRTVTRLALVLRGKSGRARVAMFVLFEYMASLFIVAASAVTFWGVAIKAMALNSLTLGECLKLSVSYFLPSISAPVQVYLPLWTSIGPALTSWSLFVLYIGPAGSLLPQWQTVTQNGVADIYDLTRQTILTQRQAMSWLRKAEKKLSS